MRNRGSADCWSIYNIYRKHDGGVRRLHRFSFTENLGKKVLTGSNYRLLELHYKMNEKSLGDEGAQVKRRKNTMKKMLVVYYSWSNGNTKRIAEQLAAATNADIARIDTAQPYTGSHEEVVEQGQREVEAGFMPQIKPLSVNISDYDVIAIGTPTWWYTMAPAVLTFLSQQNFAGKTVIPFMTNGGWPGHVIEDMEAECKGAKFAHEMKIQFDSTGGARLETQESVISKWVEDVKKDLN